MPEKTGVRDKSMLAGFRKIQRLWTYLYASPGNKIKAVNSIGAELELWMDDEAQMWAKITKSVAGKTDGKPFAYDEMLSIPIWLGIIEQLEKARPEMPMKYDAKSRWDEIMIETGIINTLNS